jgi:hypothetical protein
MHVNISVWLSNYIVSINQAEFRSSCEFPGPKCAKIPARKVSDLCTGIIYYL